MAMRYTVEIGTQKAVVEPTAYGFRFWQEDGTTGETSPFAVTAKGPEIGRIASRVLKAPRTAIDFRGREWVRKVTPTGVILLTMAEPPDYNPESDPPMPYVQFYRDTMTMYGIELAREFNAFLESHLTAQRAKAS